ncbi:MULTISPECIES: enoyl-CoA hydratase-related protein [Chitinophagaceae]
MNYSTIDIEIKDQIATIWLNRPTVRNAMNGEMIRELTEIFTVLGNRDDIRIIILRGRGTVFCAGADLNWMKDVANYSYEQNKNESTQLAKCFETIYKNPKPTIAVIHGAAMGGANGLLAACDFAYGVEDALFAFSEVKLGLIPATICPYILKRIGESKSRDLMLTGRRISGITAAKYGLLNESLPIEALKDKINETIQLLLSSGPASITQCKALLTYISDQTINAAIPYTVEMIAQARISQEGQQGMKAFLDKTKPGWVK